MIWARIDEQDNGECFLVEWSHPDEPFVRHVAFASLNRAIEFTERIHPGLKVVETSSGGIGRPYFYGQVD